jgi:DNA gyrase subunit A
MISLIIPEAGGKVLSVSENGYGKRTEIDEFPSKGRGNKGVIAMSTSARNGKLVGAVQVFDGDELMLISNQGTMVRTRTDEVSVLGRNTQGVRVIRTKEGEFLVGVERIDEPAQDPELFGPDDADADSADTASADADSAAPKTNDETGDDGAE